MAQKHKNATDLVDERLRRIRDKRLITPFIVLAIIVAAVLAWVTNVSENLKKLVGMVSATRTYEGEAYDLAENVAFAITFESDKANGNVPVPADVQRSIGQRYSEMGSELNDLGITVDYRSLDYVTRLGDFMRTNPAATFLAQQVEMRKGKKAREAFDAGLDVWSTFFNAVNKKYTVFGNDIGSGWLSDLDVLRSDARRFGVHNDLKPTDMDVSNNDSLNSWIRVEAGNLGAEIRRNLTD